MIPNFSRRALMGAALGTAFAPGAAAAADSMYKGVNIAGLEFNGAKLPGRLGYDYIAPNPAEIAYYYNCGARILRVPFLWERMQPELSGAFDPAYAALLDSVVAQGRARNMLVVLDAHQYGRRKVAGTSYIIGQGPQVTSAHFAQFWGAMAARYRTQPAWFGLTNEPHDQDLATLIAIQNAAIIAIRATGARNMVLVSGGAWSGAHSWVSSGNAAVMMGIRDSVNKFTFDVHQYLDANSSGGSGTCVTSAVNRLAAFTAWGRPNKRRGFLGEFACGTSSICNTEMRSLLDYMRANTDVWLGWSYWAGGAWWPDAYHFTIKPLSLTAPIDKPQMTILRPYF
jgi:endoglucanase